jgi:hypothetical protein
MGRDPSAWDLAQRAEGYSSSSGSAIWHFEKNLRCNSSVAIIAFVALSLPLFPIDQPVPEGRQVGRRSSIDALERRLWGVSHQWLIGQRRIGKTSVAEAVLARLREQGAVALSVDLTRLGMITSDNLAREIFAQIAEITADASEEDGAGLDKALKQLAAHARASGRHSFVLLDEVQLIAKIPDADRHLGRWCRESDSPIVFVFAGSEETAVRELREPGKPLAAVGSEFILPEISPEDWRPALRDRFAEGGVQISDRELDAIIAASGGHPRRTMLVAGNVHAIAAAQPDPVATPTLVELAINDSEQDLSWA